MIKGKRELMTLEEKTHYIKELSKIGFVKGYVLKEDVLSVLNLREEDINKSTDFDDIVNELSESDIAYHESASEAAKDGDIDVDSMTEEETGQALKDRFAHSQKILDLRQKYYALYSEFLTQKQIWRVYELENQMMKRFSQRHNAKKESARVKARKGKSISELPDRKN